MHAGPGDVRASHAPLCGVSCHHHPAGSVFRAARIPAYRNYALLADERAVYVELPTEDIRILQVAQLQRYGDRAGDALGDAYDDPGARGLGACELLPRTYPDDVVKVLTPNLNFRCGTQGSSRILAFE